MSADLYNEEIIRLAANVTHTDRLQDADISYTQTSRICGSKVTVDLKIEDGKVVAYAQEPKACALGQAACALAGELMVGQTKESFSDAATAIRNMLKGEGPIPEDDWSCFKVFAPAIDIPSRHASILLPFDAVEEAFRRIEN